MAARCTGFQWDVTLTGSSQKGLVITPPGEAAITVDSLKVAQFIYLLLENPEIRDVIDTITSKVVLILGRFTLARKPVLDALRDKLREKGYSPVLFDFEKPATRSYRETVSTLAHMARFVVADLTDAKVVLQELERIVPALPSVPIQPNSAAECARQCGRRRRLQPLSLVSANDLLPGGSGADCKLNGGDRCACGRDARSPSPPLA